MALGATLRKLKDDDGISLSITAGSEYNNGTIFCVIENVDQYVKCGDEIELVIENDIMSTVYYGIVDMRLVIGDQRLLGIQHDHMSQPNITWMKNEWMQ